MGVKPARKYYTREEVLDILHRNAALYKDDEGFVEFFAELALYLLQYVEGASRPAQAWPEPLPPSSREVPIPVELTAPNRAAPQPMPPPPVASGNPEDGPYVLPPTVDELRRRASQDFVAPRLAAPQAFQAPRPAPPPPPPPPPPFSGDEFDMPSGTFASPYQSSRSQIPKPQIEVDRVSLTPFSDSGTVKKISPQAFRDQHAGAASGAGPAPPNPEPPPMPPGPHSSPEVAPPGGSSGEVPKGFVQRTFGKARVYKVSRNYRSSTSAEVPCHVCGNMIPLGAKHCPGCGTPVSS